MMHESRVANHEQKARVAALIADSSSLIARPAESARG